MAQKIGFTDVDGHNFPNLALMKLSFYHRSKGDHVEWYSPDEPMYDIVYMSKVFSNAYTEDVPVPLNAERVIKGGSGYAIWLEGDKEVYHKEFDPPLPYEIEHCQPDYDLYPQFKNTAYGYLTRGCPRGCAFCHVAGKEGRATVRASELSEFWTGQKNICLSDPNILAYPKAEELLEELANTGAKIDFNQGLDARLMTPKKAEMLAKMKLRCPHFAMDSMDEVGAVVKGIKMYVDACKHIKGKWDWRDAKVFCLVNFNTTFREDLLRIQLIQDCECWPYVMIYNKPSAPAILRRLQRWTNSPQAYAAAPNFEEYQRRTYKEILYD